MSGSSLLSRLVHNGIWLVLALICSMSVEVLLFNGNRSLHLPEACLLGAVMLSCALLIDTFSSHNEPQMSFFRQSLMLILTASLLLFLMAQWNGLSIPDTYPVLIALLLFVAFRGLSFAFSDAWHYPEWMSTKVMVLGSGPAAQKTQELIENSQGRYLLKGVIPFDGPGDPSSLKDKDALFMRAKRAGVTRLIVSFPERRGIMPVQDILRCRLQGMVVIDAHTFYEKMTRKLFIESLTPSCFIFSTGFGLSSVRRALKRASDIGAAVIGLCLTLPFFPLIALFIKLDSRGPVFFRQIRTGLAGKSFCIFKFRTMRADAEEKTGAVWATAHDPRVTKLGRFMRKTRIDEIPQLFNVLRGEMSLVGPRPERPEFISKLEKTIPFYSERHFVKPGVTGWAQVRYPYGSSIEDALEKLRYDLYYIKNQSFALDFEIVLRTILVVFTGSGAR